jgi:hypothetical protein
VALVYCEICGVLIKGPQSHAPIPEGVICDGCFDSRRAVVTRDEPVAPDPDTMVQFNCCYCRSLLRLRAVTKRSRIKCPKCADAFYLHPDGRIESRLEGNTTAIISSDQALGSLTPPTGQAPADKTQPMSREGLNKTQPILRAEPPPTSRQQALLEGLKPKKLDFLDDVPARDRAAAMVDTDAYEGPAGSPLDLLPDGKGPGDVKPALRPSEEGRVDLDAEGLRRKTQQYQQNAATGARGTKKHKQAEPSPDEAPAGEPRGGKRDKRTTEKHARKTDKTDKREAEKDAKREERERRAAEAAKKAQELAAAEAKKSLGALTLTLIAVAPTIVALLLLSMTTRGTGFAVRGAFGERMNDVGQGVDRGVRSLGGMVNPYLPPEYRLPQVADAPR